MSSKLFNGDDISSILESEGPVVSCVLLRASDHHGQEETIDGSKEEAVVPQDARIEKRKVCVHHHLIEQITVDTTPRKSQVSAILGGPVTFLGQYEDEGIVIVIRRSQDESLKPNPHVLQPPFHDKAVRGDILLIRVNTTLNDQAAEDDESYDDDESEAEDDESNDGKESGNEEEENDVRDEEGSEGDDAEDHCRDREEDGNDSDTSWTETTGNDKVDTLEQSKHYQCFKTVANEDGGKETTELLNGDDGTGISSVSNGAEDRKHEPELKNKVDEVDGEHETLRSLNSANETDNSSDKADAVENGNKDDFFLDYTKEEYIKFASRTDVISSVELENCDSVKEDDDVYTSFRALLANYHDKDKDEEDEDDDEEYSVPVDDDGDDNDETDILEESEECRIVAMNILLAKTLQQFRNENGRGADTRELLEMRSRLAERLGLEVPAVDGSDWDTKIVKSHSKADERNLKHNGESEDSRGCCKPDTLESDGDIKNEKKNSQIGRRKRGLSLEEEEDVVDVNKKRVKFAQEVALTISSLP